MQERIVYDVNDMMDLFEISKMEAYKLMTSNSFPTIFLNKTPYVSAAALKRWMSSKEITKDKSKR